MSVSSISSPPPSLPLPNSNTNTQPAPAVTANNNDNANDAGTVQPPALAPLPPGQGTRVDQLV